MTPPCFRLKSVPVKWLAPETLLKGIYSKETDVWLVFGAATIVLFTSEVLRSFGVLMWEIWSKCKRDPYPGMNNAEARRAIINELRYTIAPLSTNLMLILDFKFLMVHQMMLERS